MKNLRLPFLAAVLSALAVAPPCAIAADASAARSAASAAAPAASAAASAPAVVPSAVSPSRGGKRPATPQENRDTANAPSVVNPAQRVAPQINVPLNPSGAGKATYVRPSRGNGAPSGGIDDSAARCNAIEDAQQRKDCIDKLNR